VRTGVQVPFAACDWRGAAGVLVEDGWDWPARETEVTAKPIVIAIAPPETSFC